MRGRQRRERRIGHARHRLAHHGAEPGPQGRDRQRPAVLPGRLRHPDPEGPGRQPQADVATKWEYDKTRTRLALTLRDGVKFSGGAPFDGAAVMANMKRFRKGGGGSAKTLAALRRVTVEDPTHVTLILSAPDPALLFQLSDAAGLMADPAEFAGSSLTTTPAGTGPYELDKTRTAVGNKYVYPRKTGYWGAKLPFETLAISAFDNETAVVNGLKTGQIDTAVLQDTNQQAAIASGIRLKKTDYTFDFQGLLLFDRAGALTPALAKPQVRQAINYDLDRETMLDKLRRGRGELTSQIYGPGTKAYDKALDTYYDHDPAKARKLLAEAGYAKGFTLRLPRAAALVSDALASSIATDLKAVGITVRWDLLDGNSALRKIYRERAYSATVMNNGQNPVDWTATQDLVAPGVFNLFGSTDATVRKLLQRIQTGTATQAARAARALNRHLVEQAWFAPFYRMRYELVTGPDVKARTQSGMAVPSLYDYTPTHA
ncbi:ABC transporter substrate-binding protein [Streptomyces sp. SPB074]|uniref:ABC transporter substrate-binding protein n=1 Tax=Streptomyces sp. (strain SPB074) TaxID=465543 RepID=UPI00017FEF1A|nr:ABC transporter substrate-binding protein [Streptomyces sp. SPB074]EDY46664.1 bacterial extracellular solute-binding protein, family 5 [Streptomyces sp. SPB074]